MKVTRYAIFNSLGYFHESGFVTRFEDATLFKSRDEARTTLRKLTAFDVFFIPGFLHQLQIVQREVSETLLSEFQF